MIFAIEKLLCKLGFHDRREQKPDIRFNPDWRYDGCVGSIVTDTICIRPHCRSAKIVEAEDLQWWDVSYGLINASDEEAYEALEKLHQRVVWQYRKRRIRAS